jgi:excisionase family DNA binding protein
VDGNNERLLTPGEVAALFRVDPKTVTRWAASGRITSIRTPGGHRRFRESEVRALLRGDTEIAPEGHPAVSLAKRAGTLLALVGLGIAPGPVLVSDEPGELLELPEQRRVTIAPLVLALRHLIGGERLRGEPGVVSVLGADLHVHIADDPPLPGVDGGVRNLEVPVR